MQIEEIKIQESKIKDHRKAVKLQGHFNSLNLGEDRNAVTALAVGDATDDNAIQRLRECDIRSERRMEEADWRKR